MYLSIIFLPLIGAITAGLFGRYIGKQGAIILTTTLVFLSSLAIILFVLHVPFVKARGFKGFEKFRLLKSFVNLLSIFFNQIQTGHKNKWSQYERKNP